ncbi:uncharacterized protein [Procambarus clarkii]|nr:uncharacterized protein LOC123765831 [Procambarus clarkii]
MSSRRPATVTLMLLLLVRVSLAEPKRSLWLEATTDEVITQETKVLTIESVVSTVVTTVYHAVTVYPTCTTTVVGVTACAPMNAHLTHLIQPPASDQHSRASSVASGETTSFDVVEMVMPSCDCGGGEGRRPRLLHNQLITIKSFKSLTVDRLTTTTDQSTTVSITYDGCVPTDALTTTACHLL